MNDGSQPMRRTLPAVPRSPDGFAHAVLRTSRYEEMIAWYTAVLNAHVIFRSDKLCFISYDDEHHRLALSNVAGLPPQDNKSLRLMHLAYSYAELGSLFGTYRRLKAQGILPYRTINHGMTVSFYYRDPDGTQIELQADAFATKDEAQAFMESDAFAANPIGVLIDPEEIIAAWEAGVPETDLKRRPEGPPAASQSQTFK